MEMLEIHVISNGAITNNLLIIREKKHCNTGHLKLIIRETMKILLRLRSTMTLLAHTAKTVGIIERIIKKLGFEQLRWETELESLKRMKIKISRVFEGRGKDTKKRIEIRNLNQIWVENT